MRGSVIALTDEEGNIIETYNYDPFGNLLSNPTIYNPKLFIGRDDVLYDSETKLYYMHARYYDPEADRFIMKDSVFGLLSNPITQNSYIYCANDPINKIDLVRTILLYNSSQEGSNFLKIACQIQALDFFISFH